MRSILAIVLLIEAGLLYATSASLSAIVPAAEPSGYLWRGILLTLLGLISCVWHASGPRYGEKVALTPLVTLVALLILPPSICQAPIVLVAALSVIGERDLSRRLAHLDKFLVLLAAQAGTGIVLHDMYLGAASVQDGAGAEVGRVLAATAALLGAIYLGGLAVTGAWKTRIRAAGYTSANVEWANEAAVYLIGCPIAALVSLSFGRFEPIVCASLLLVVAAALVAVSRSLIDGKLARVQLRAMERMTQQAAIGKSPSAERFLSEFLDHCRRLTQYDHAMVWLHNDGELVLEKRLEYSGEKSVSFQPALRRSGEELVGRVAERGKPILVADVRRDSRHRFNALSEDEKLALGPVSAMLIPLLAGGDLVGVVEFERRSLSPYDKQDRERIQSLAGLVAMSLANNRLHQDVIQQAVTDGLTGLYNKRQILKTLHDEAARAQRYGNALSVMMLDLDGFKKFNDTYGHMQGDVLLQSIAELIKDSIRTSDVAGRYGGEEFIVVMPETGREAAWVSAERIRARVEAQGFPVIVNYEAAIGLEERTEDRQPREVVVQKTISIGVATFPADALDGQSLLARADEALYTAKNSGRNQVVLASYPAESQPRTIIEMKQG